MTVAMIIHYYSCLWPHNRPVAYPPSAWGSEFEEDEMDRGKSILLQNEDKLSFIIPEVLTAIISAMLICNGSN